MSEIKQNYGNLAVSGVMIALKVKEYTSKKVLTFGVKTREDRIVYVNFQGFSKEDDDIIYTDKKVNKKTIKSTNTYVNREWLEDDFEPSDIKLKITSDGEVKGYVAIDAIDLIMKNFKNGDSIFVLLHTEADTYHDNIQFNVTQLYKSSSEIDFNSEDFTEKNSGKQWVVINEINKDNITGVIFNKKQGFVRVDFKLNEKFVTQQMFIDNNLKQGSVVELNYEYGKKPLYEDAPIKEVKKEDTKKFKPIGKYATTANNTYKQVTGYEETFTCVGINNIKFDENIDLSAILAINNDEEKPFE